MEGGAVGVPLQAVHAQPIPLLEARPEPGHAPILHHRMVVLYVFLAVEQLLLTHLASKLRQTLNLATALLVRLFKHLFLYVFKSMTSAKSALKVLILK
jgi:hypothetical protein